MSLVQFRSKQTDPIQEFINNDYLFAPFYSLSNLNGNTQRFLNLDVAEEKEGYTIEADLPGIKKEDVHLSFDNGVLTIEAERQSQTENKDKEYHRVERSYGKFVRSVSLGTGIDANAITANYKDGVLTVRVPKSEKAKPKSIAIQAE